MWLSRKGGQREGPVIAPICKSCNYWKKKSTRQDGGSRLRPGAYAEAEYTEEMKTAKRRFKSTDKKAAEENAKTSDMPRRCADDAEALADGVSKLSL